MNSAIIMCAPALIVLILAATVFKNLLNWSVEKNVLRRMPVYFLTVGSTAALVSLGLFTALGVV